eukprot:Platyproteum_vivax@DN5110_c0_g1_i2.p1
MKKPAPVKENKKRPRQEKTGGLIQTETPTTVDSSDDEVEFSPILTKTAPAKLNWQEAKAKAPGTKRMRLNKALKEIEKEKLEQSSFDAQQLHAAKVTSAREKALKRASGEKILDNETLIKKQVHKMDVKKRKSTAKYMARQEEVKEAQLEKSKRRQKPQLGDRSPTPKKPDPKKELKKDQMKKKRKDREERARIRTKGQKPETKPAKVT